MVRLPLGPIGLAWLAFCRQSALLQRRSPRGGARVYQADAADKEMTQRIPLVTQKEIPARQYQGKRRWTKLRWLPVGNPFGNQKKIERW